MILKLSAEENLSSDDIGRIDITVPPYTHKLVGHPFEIGDNPKVNAQFSIQYCVANALLRRASKLAHFEEEAIRDPRIAVLLKKIHLVSDRSLEARGHTPVDMRVVVRDGREYSRKMNLAPGFPGNELSEIDHEERFWDCVDFAGMPIRRENAQKIASMVEAIEALIANFSKPFLSLVRASRSYIKLFFCRSSSRADAADPHSGGHTCPGWHRPKAGGGQSFPLRVQ